MIQANELRIGNWAARESGTPEYITSGLLSEIDKFEISFFGIPLTPEILEKCGLVKDEDESAGVQYNGEQAGCTIHYTLDDNCLILDFENEYAVRNTLMIYGIKFLHTMQNAFYLTGIELEINLT